MTDLPQLKLHLCADCLTETGEQGLAAIVLALDQAGLGTCVDACLATCLERCDAPLAMTLQRKGAATYVFSNLDPMVDAADIAATCRTYLDSPGGWIEDARPCGRLRFCLATRVPG